MAVTKRILLTSFATWKAHQASNTSDDLLEAIAQIPALAPSLHFFRQLPVNRPVAQEIVMAKMRQVQPDILICCGMAETRQQLTVEAQAAVGQSVLATNLDLKALTQGLTHTAISYDAGRFVCNSLYHAMLNYLKSYAPEQTGLFVHVPPLTLKNRGPIVVDFCQIIERLLH